MKEKGKKKSKKLVWQILPILFVCFLIAIVVCGFGMYDLAMKLLLDEEYQKTSIIANGLLAEFEKEPNMAWLFQYWTEHAEDMQDPYCLQMDGFDKTVRFHNQPDVIYNDRLQLDPEQFSERTQRYYAEEQFYSWIQEMDAVKRTYDMEFLFTVVVSGENEITYILTGARPDETRGTRPDQIYPLGLKSTLDRSEYQPLFDAYETGKPSTEIIATTQVEDGQQGEHRYHMYVPFVQDGRTVCVIGISLKASQVMELMMHRLITVEIIAILVLVGSAVLLTVLIRRIVLKPMLKIQESVDTFAQDMDADKLSQEISKLGLHNEIGTLAQDMSGMGHILVNYIAEVKDMTQQHEKLEAELSLATRIQESALSKDFDCFPKEWGVDIYAIMDPAKEVGGDFYDFKQMDDDHMLMVVGDVSGKGVPAALFMMISKVLLANDSRYIDSPKAILEEVNQKLCEKNEAEMFVTVWLGILTISTGTLITANAGHEYPMVLRADGTVEVIKDKHGLALGIMEGAKYKEYEIQLQRGDTILQYTDGAPEAANMQDEMYTAERIGVALGKASGCSAQELIDTIKQDIDTFVGEAEQFDDTTILAMRYKKECE